MTPTKPDRWERMVQHITTSDINIPKQFCYSDEVTDLLRKEHAAVVRMIKRLGVEYRTSDHDSDEHRSPAENLIIDILDQLKRRAK